MAVCVAAPQPEPAYKETAHLEELSGPMRKLLEGYSGIEPWRMASHIDTLVSFPFSA